MTGGLPETLLDWTEDPVILKSLLSLTKLLLTYQNFADISQVAEEAGRQDQEEQTGGDEGRFVLYKEGQNWSNRSKWMWLITSRRSATFWALLHPRVQSFMMDLSGFMLPFSVVFTLAAKTKALSS